MKIGRRTGKDAPTTPREASISAQDAKDDS